MTFQIRIGLCALVMIAVAGCDDQMMTETDPASASGASGMMAPANGQPFRTTMDPSVSPASVSACQSALQARVDGGVTVVGSEFSQANNAVYLRVGANGAPWQCVVSDDGSDPFLTFIGSEGAA